MIWYLSIGRAGEDDSFENEKRGFAKLPRRAGTSRREPTIR
jgi:hypothetical protein